MKLFIQSFFLLFILTSCHRSTYYAYVEPNMYITVELTKSNNVILRGGANLNYPQDIKFLHIFSSQTALDNSYIGIGKNFALHYINNSLETVPCFSFKDINIDNLYLDYSHITKDSLVLIKHSQKNILFLNEPCFEKTGLTWFPPYLKKVKKIDYDKFNLPNIKKKYLKTMADKDR